MNAQRYQILLAASLVAACGPQAPTVSEGSGSSGSAESSTGGVPADDDWIVGPWHLGKTMGSAERAVNFDFYPDGTVVPSGDWCGTFGTGDPGTWELNDDNTVTARAAPGGSLNGQTEIVFSSGVTCSSMTGVGDGIEVPYEHGLTCISPVPCDGPGECDCGEMVWCDGPPAPCE